MTPEELLEQAVAEWGECDVDEGERGVMERRRFLFCSLVAAAASAFGMAMSLRAQAGGAARPQTPPPPPLPLGNAEAPALQFQPYPGGTGALLEKLVRERGRAAFE